MFELKKTEGRARRGVFNTPHGAIETPFFMNVGTAAAIKGGISSIDLKGLRNPGGAVQYLSPPPAPRR